MRLAVISHKVAWPASSSPSGYATDGGFPMQMRALSELFDETHLCIPVLPGANRGGDVPLGGRGLTVVPLREPWGGGLGRKVLLLLWLLLHLPLLLREIAAADVVHTPIPGDVGTLGWLLAVMLRKRVFVRHCGNWLNPQTPAERLWRWLMETSAGIGSVMLATGGTDAPPSAKNAHVRWIFSSSVTAAEIAALGRPKELQSGERRLAIVCRQDLEKGTGVVLEALAKLKTTCPIVSLDVVGEGPALETFRARAEALGIAESVRFHGRLNHEGVLEVLQRADLFCYPTRASEGFPKVVLEALACGLPVIATPVSVLPSLLRSGGGTILKAAEPAELSAVILRILNDPEAYAMMSRQAVAIARGFSLEAWRDRIADEMTESWGADVVRARA
ncbi:MAG: glycosyltransferase [Bryobacteraceae bacterium]|nr:glycosyltransferase [Bryobacteraceae bacterium]